MIRQKSKISRELSVRKSLLICVVCVNQFNVCKIIWLLRPLQLHSRAIEDSQSIRMKANIYSSHKSLIIRDLETHGGMPQSMLADRSVITHAEHRVELNYKRRNECLTTYLLQWYKTSRRRSLTWKYNIKDETSNELRDLYRKHLSKSVHAFSVRAFIK